MRILNCFKQKHFEQPIFSAFPSVRTIREALFNMRTCKWGINVTVWGRGAMMIPSVSGKTRSAYWAVSCCFSMLITDGQKVWKNSAAGRKNSLALLHIRPIPLSLIRHLGGKWVEQKRRYFWWWWQQKCKLNFFFAILYGGLFLIVSLIMISETALAPRPAARKTTKTSWNTTMPRWSPRRLLGLDGYYDFSCQCNSF